MHAGIEQKSNEGSSALFIEGFISVESRDGGRINSHRLGML